MFKKIILAASIIIIIIISVSTVIVLWQQKIKKTVALETVKMGYVEWPGVLPYLVAYEKGYFKEGGVDVKFKKEDSNISQLSDLTTGEIDCAGTVVLIDVLGEVAKGADLAVVGATDYSNGADGIVAKTSIKSINQLKGKKIAVEKKTLGEYLLITALEKAGLSEKDITMIDLSAAEAAKEFIAGKVDAAVTYEPNLTEAEKSGHIIFTSAQTPYLITDVLAFNRKWIDQKPAIVQAFYDAYLKGVDFIKSNSDDAYKIGAEYFGITSDEFKNQLSGLKILGKEENLSAFSHNTGDESLYASSIDLLSFLRNVGTVDTDVDVEKTILRRFVKSLEY